MRLSVRIVTVFCLATIFMMAACGVALAYDESVPDKPSITPENCGDCHDPYFSVGAGVHGGYTSTTSKCEECHTVHNAPADGIKLLPAATIQATCFTCHDGTQGRGVYGAIAARGLTVTSGHRIDVTNIVPGGDATTGGSAAMSFRGESGNLTCIDCHSPHASKVVAAYLGDRIRDSGMPALTLTHALKQSPGDSAAVVTEYGSDWCLACHAGRRDGISDVHNHPVDDGAGSFPYSGVARLASDDPTTLTEIGNLGGSNRGYIMPFPRTAQQGTHAPICQQCHEDARNVGTLSWDGATGDAATFNATIDGVLVGNPRFQNFPHESTNAKLLVETQDDLCTNCHAQVQLP